MSYVVDDALAGGLDGPVLEGLDRAGAAAEHRGGLLDAEVGDQAEQQHLTLGGGEIGENPAQLAFRDAGERLGLGVVGGPARGHPVERLLVAPAPVVVDDLVVGDREDPRSELRLGAVEPVDVLPRREQHLVDEVVGRVAHLRHGGSGATGRAAVAGRCSNASERPGPGAAAADNAAAKSRSTLLYRAERPRK